MLLPGLHAGHEAGRLKLQPQHSLIVPTLPHFTTSWTSMPATVALPFSFLLLQQQKQKVEMAKELQHLMKIPQNLRREV